jgi:hypothetical protein
MTDQSRLNIIVESQTDADIIRAMYGQAFQKRVKFYAGQGKASLATLARNLIVHEGSPTLLVMDSDTTDSRRVAEQKATVEFALRAAINPGSPNPPQSTSLPVRVFAFVPEIEIVFFEAPRALERILGIPIPPERMREGLLAPKAAIADVLLEVDSGIGERDIVAKIDHEAASLLGAGKQALALSDAIQSLLTTPVEVQA